MKAKLTADHGICAIIGADSYLAERALDKVLAAHLGQTRGEAVEVLRGDEVTWALVAEAARTPSLFSPRRAVIVRQADAIRDSDDKVNKRLEGCAPGILLVLMAVKPDRRRTVWRQIAETAQVVSAEPLKGRALRSYVSAELQTRGLALTEDALDEILERVGGDLRRLIGEVDKLESYASGERPLGAETVAKVLGKSLARPLYRLADSFCERRTVEALEVLEELLDEGEAGLRILATLHRALRQIRGARALESSGSRGDVAARLGVMPFRVESVLRAGRLWSTEDLVHAQDALREADLRMKASVDVRLALTTAVAACHVPAGRARRRQV